MSLNIASFFPGRGWTKKGFPLIAKRPIIVNTNNSGDKTIKEHNETQKSKKRLKKDLYI